LRLAEELSSVSSSGPADRVPGVPRPVVTLTAQSMWRLRAARELPRYLLYGACAAGLAASARFAIAPPHASVHTVSVASGPQVDLAAEGFASLFARRYLGWNAAEPRQHVTELAALGGEGAEAADVRLPSRGEQRVLWTAVVQARSAQPGERVYTVAAETDTDGIVYLTVPVARLADGRLALAGYPAFVGPPASASARLGGGAQEVTEEALSTVVSRALRNYLAGSPDELAADLATGTRVSLPTQPLSLESVVHASWSNDGRSVLAVVRASDARGVEYTLGYELDVLLVHGRWEVSAVQMDPTA
jgi:Conjugative transposon protein TcpC